MGWHGADIPPAILMKQMKVSNSASYSKRDPLSDHWKGLLAYRSILQRGRPLCQSIDLAAVFPRLSNQKDAPCMLDLAGCPRNLWFVGGGKRLSQLCPSRQILESHTSRILLEYERAMVLECLHAYPHRCGYPDLADSRARHPGYFPSTEDCAGWYLCPGRIVS
jgi:hypothetical protein